MTIHDIKHMIDVEGPYGSAGVESMTSHIPFYIIELPAGRLPDHRVDQIGM